MKIHRATNLFEVRSAKLHIVSSARQFCLPIITAFPPCSCHQPRAKRPGLFSHRRKPVGKPLMSSVGIFWPSEAGTQPKQAPSPTHRHWRLNGSKLQLISWWENHDKAAAMRPELRTSGSQIAWLAWKKDENSKKHRSEGCQFWRLGPNITLHKLDPPDIELVELGYQNMSCRSLVFRWFPMISNVLCRPCRLGLKISDVIITEPGLGYGKAMTTPWPSVKTGEISQPKGVKWPNKRKQARRRWMKMLFRQLNLAVGLRRWAQNIPKPSEHRAAQWVQNFARWRRRKSKAKEVTTSPWLGKALLENVTSRRILGTSLLDKEILKDYMFRSNPPDGTSLQYLDGILISVWFAFINRVVTLQFWCHCCGYGHMISLKLSANWGFGSCQESSTTTLRQGNVWKHGVCFPSGQHLKKIKGNFQDLPISRKYTQLDPGTQDSAYPFPWPYPVRT